MERRSRRSIRVAVAETGPEGQEEDLQVEAEAPALDVVELVFDPFLDRGLASPAVDLRPARDARLHLVTEHVPGHPPPELLDEARALGARADEAHFTAQDVPELGQLVEAEASEEGPEARAPRIVRPRPDGPGLALGVHAHRAELEHAEALAVQAHPLLAEEDGPRGGELEEDGDREHHGGGEKERQPAHDEVEEPLDHAVPAVEGGLAQMDEGDRFELLDAPTERGEAEHVGDEVDRDEVVADLVENGGEARVFAVRQGDEHDVDLLPVENGADLLDAPEPRRVDPGRV